MRHEFNFADFKRDYIDSPKGWMAVYASFEESHYSEQLRTLKIDMICEWRLDDGKLHFVQVDFETEDELEQLKAYLRSMANELREEIVKRVDKLLFSETTDNPREEGDEEEDEE